MRRFFWGSKVARTAWIHPTASVDRTFPGGIEIGDSVWIGPFAMVLSHDMARGVYRSTRIGARTVIGARAVIMPGATIGDDCVIEPGAVVSSDVPNGSHASGNPARVRKGTS
ncbi:hypothetical protein GCM10011515_14890 [Tsuneonella deserti]|uniref:Acyltransferase n=1 Tax=Tsuneonella deserti TaxID=2035528 RepID=A0ABQ1S8M4_9SPHN|nr:hypothetical protein GCM10011515_14890 [Tsuneonella deserti]